jgi:hypothetical protein
MLTFEKSDWPLRQYLHFCTSKASKLSTFLIQRAGTPQSPALCVFVRMQRECVVRAVVRVVCISKTEQRTECARIEMPLLDPYTTRSLQALLFAILVGQSGRTLMASNIVASAL